MGKLEKIKPFLGAEATQGTKSKRSALLVAVTHSEVAKKIPRLEFAKQDIEQVKNCSATILRIVNSTSNT
jgi:hypothetical protein